MTVASKPRTFLPALCVAAFFVTALLAGCGDSGNRPADQAALDSVDLFPDRFTTPIEEAHADSLWRTKEALAADLVVRFDGRTTLDGRLLMQTDLGRVRIELGGDTVAVFDGSTAWVAPDSTALPRARFTLLTWPYFVAVPYKLRDPGTRLERRGRMPIEQAPTQDDAAFDKTMPAARLTFASGTGDTPDDWYMIYRDPQTNRVAAMGYVVTYGGVTPQEAIPHAVVYDRYRSVEGVPVPTEWTFYNWTEEEGPHGQPIGRVTLRDLRFVTPAGDAFAPPPGAERSSLPASS